MVQVSTATRSSLFAGLSDKEVQDLLDAGRVVTFPAGELIVRRGDQGDVMYFILSGLVEVIRVLGTDGPQFSRLALGEGEFFGEIAILLEGKARTANVVALEPATCLVMSKEGLERAVERYPMMALSMLRIMSKRLRALVP